MAIDVDSLPDQQYYELFHKELTEATASLGWKVLVAKDRPWRFIAETPGWTYIVTAHRWQQPQIEPLNMSKSYQKLTSVLTEILTKPRH